MGGGVETAGEHMVHGYIQLIYRLIGLPLPNIGLFTNIATIGNVSAVAVNLHSFCLIILYNVCTYSRVTRTFFHIILFYLPCFYVTFFDYP